MNTLSFIQPWAWAVMQEVKHLETRSWRPFKTGLIAIHASKTGKDVQEMLETMAHAARMRNGSLEGSVQGYFRDALRDAGLTNTIDIHAAMHYGCVLGVARILSVRPTPDVRNVISARERAWGDYRDQRWAIELQVVQVFEQPVAARGQLGLWQWSPPDGLLSPEVRL